MSLLFTDFVCDAEGFRWGEGPCWWHVQNIMDKDEIGNGDRNTRTALQSRPLST